MYNVCIVTPAYNKLVEKINLTFSQKLSLYNLKLAFSYKKSSPIYLNPMDSNFGLFLLNVSNISSIYLVPEQNIRTSLTAISPSFKPLILS